MVERFDPAARRLRPVAVVDTLARSVTMEMDLRLEAAALSEMAEATAGDPGFRVPKVEWERTAREVLTLEWIDGIKLSDPRGARGPRATICPSSRRKLMQAFLRHALRDGFFHADMHQGNLFVDAAGDIVAVDFGIMGRLSRAERRFLAEILFGFIRRDYRRVAEVHFEAGYVPAERHSVDDFAQALRAIGEPIHGQRARDISMARLLTLLFEVTELFDMQTRPELLLRAEDDGGGRGRRPLARPGFRHVVGVRAGGARLDRALPRPGRPDRGGGREASARSAGWSPGCPSWPSGRSGCRRRWTGWARDGLRLAPETVEAIGQSEAQRRAGAGWRCG